MDQALLGTDFVAPPPSAYSSGSLASATSANYDINVRQFFASYNKESPLHHACSTRYYDALHGMARPQGHNKHTAPPSTSLSETINKSLWQWASFLMTLDAALKVGMIDSPLRTHNYHSVSRKTCQSYMPPRTSGIHSSGPRLH
jgi:hypothetical protein